VDFGEIGKINGGGDFSRTSSMMAVAALGSEPRRAAALIGRS
jgi:hypothetical protein